MSPSYQTVLELLIAANIAAYIFLLLGVLRGRSRKPPRNPSIEEAFRFLESALKQAFPDLPEGFTWKEVTSRLKSLDIDVNWAEVEDTLRKYEAFRYGGIEYQNANADSVLQLASELPRGEKIVRGSQIKSIARNK